MKTSRGQRGRYDHDAALQLGRSSGPQQALTAADLSRLPDPAARYVRRTGAVGQPMVTNFRARIHGRIRGGAEEPWMRFRGEQVNTCAEELNRLFFITASMRGIPVAVFHRFVDESATMTVKALSLFTIVDAHGPEMNRSETVTILNDLCVLAPAALVHPAVQWQAIDDRSAIVTLTRFDETVSARLVFDGDDQLVDFVSDDRARSSRDGRAFTAQRWSTPLLDGRDMDGRHLMTHGEARWHAPAPEGEFTYLEFELDDITYNVTS
jgi:hypothetical protein